jgi:CDP-diacylglycerol---serine O-phosphatidyltransferase
MNVPEGGRLQFFRRADDRRRPRFRRGVSLLPSLFTIGNLFCGYACVVHTMRGAFETAALFVGFAIVLDMLDGRIARLTGTTSDFGLQFDSLADVVSFGIAPAILTFAWGLAPLGRWGWAAGFIFVTAGALRLARFNIQSVSGGDKRYFVGMPIPTAAGVPAATVFAYPYGIADYRGSLVALAIVLVPAVLMVSTIRFRSFKTIDLRTRRPYTVLLGVAAALVLIATEPRWVLLGMAYTYMVSAFIGMAITRLRSRDGGKTDAAATEGESPRNTAAG